jgi:hypothetical protein
VLGHASNTIGGEIVMARGSAHPSGIDAFRPDPRPAIPTQLQAPWLWLVAVAAGLFETALVVVDATSGEVGSAAQVAAGVAVRLLVFTGAVYLAAQRVVHLGAVVAAVLLMFHPAANADFRATTPAPAQRGTRLKRS